jgi:hypothetical protein
MKWAIAAVTTMSVLSGCQTTDDVPPPSSMPATLTGPTASAIAGDMASRLAEQVGTASTTTLKMAKDTSEYAAALEAALKGWGYTVVTDDTAGKNQKPIDVAWAIDSVDGRVLARLSTPMVTIGRAYATTTTGATPASPLSIIRKN